MSLDDRTNDNKKQGYIQGELLYTIFHNESEHFTIAKFKVIDTNEDFKEKEIVGKGYFTNLQEGTTYSFFGVFETHPKFGLQYNIQSYQTYIPDSRDGLIAYLSSDLFYGVGKKTAQRIIDHLGETAISKILDNPKVVSEIPGLKNETGKLLADTLRENQGFEHIVVYLSRYGIGLKLSQKIYEKYKEDAITILEEDPYQYVFDIDGFGFQTADSIAQKNGLSLTHPNRIGAGCIYILDKSIQDGHVYLPIDYLVERVMELLMTETLAEDNIIERLKELNVDKTIIIQDEKVYLPSLYYAEDGFASHLKRIISHEIEEEATLADLLKIIGDIEEAEVLSYGKEQFSAIQKALHSKVMIVTGGPGTGKTTVIKGIINAYGEVHQVSTDVEDYENQQDYPFVLTAPTGRAAKRLNESTGLPAVTIHRLLGWNGKDSFEKNEHEQLSGKFIIIDEFSMVDIWLANHLFKAIPDDMQVLLVGDEDQLPSVGPGQVLSDLLSSEVIPLVSLSEVYRQKEGSKIIQLAHLIKNDTCTIEQLKNDKDFSYIPCREHQMIDVITQIFSKAKEKGVDLKDIQVLAPMYRSTIGINEINRHLQAIVNPKKRGKREKRTKDAVFRVGDKVIQLVNQYEDGVSNGDIGEIVAIFEEDENTDHVEQIVLSFDGKEVVYEQKDYINFMHAYCISIHKAQGSEFPIVILPIVSSYRRMLRKNLIYTAITRGQQSLIICGEQHAFLQGIQTFDTNKRYTSLTSQLTARLTGVKSATNEEDEEIELSPYDFM
jgi:exodeoxyribonuclease V alpha subunit